MKEYLFHKLTNKILFFILTDNMSSAQCMYCLTDRIRIPCFYKESCFRCVKEPGRPGCHSIKRYCLLCIRNHLQLNQRRDNRTTLVKCPLCPATTNPRLLKQENAYEPDYRMMDDDPATDYPCFHSEKGCNFVGSQTGLHRHIKECDYATTSCSYCGAYFEKHFRETHEITCPALSGCPFCPSRMPFGEVYTHCRDEHQRLKCTHCDQWIHTDTYDAHFTTLCPMRRINCSHCHSSYTAANKNAHLMVHMEEIDISMGIMANEMRQLRARMNRVLREMKE